MKFEIKHRISSEVLFSLETESFKLCIEAAVRSSANLRYADLRSADLSFADLRFANLCSADLSYADLRFADLRSADLRSADLSFADLRSADLRSADLRSADLRYAKGCNKYRCTPLTILQDQVGKIRAYKIVNANMEGPYKGGVIYKRGEIVEAKGDTDDTHDCGAGINLATLDWCMREWQEGYRILIAEFTAKDIAAIPICSGGKFRVHRCKIVGEKDLVEIGLVEPTAGVH